MASVIFTIEILPGREREKNIKARMNTYIELKLFFQTVYSKIVSGLGNNRCWETTAGKS